MNYKHFQSKLMAIFYDRLLRVVHLCCFGLMKKALVEGNRMSSWRSYDKESLHGLTTTRRATVCLGTPPSSRRQLNASLFHSAKSTDSVVYSSAEDLTIDIGHCAVSLEHRRHHSAVGWPFASFFISISFRDWSTDSSE